MAIDLSKVTSVVTRPVGDGGGPVAVQLSGSSQDLRGLLADRPAANSVPVGTTFWAIDRIGQADEVTVSNGSAWVNS